jgi:hypothetical protein
MNISNALSLAKENEKVWDTKNLFSVIILILRRIERAWISWDEESGEEWAKIMHYDSVIAYINATIPIIMIKTGEVSKAIIPELEKKYPIIPFTNPEQKEFSVNMSAFERAFPDNKWRNAICEPDNFSAQELYFMTAS